MISFLASLFIKSTDQAAQRRGYGMLCGVVGIGLNVFLFATKCFAGIVSGSIAITADAFNNLSDAGSSLVTLLGFHLAGQKPDLNHPFGHGRLEYVSGLVVAMMIILMGEELFCSALDKILHPQSIEFSWLVVGILLLSIGVKCHMFFYNRTLGRKLDSPAMEATAVDSLSDALATLVVLISVVVEQVTALQIDGWCGLVVSGFIVIAGIRAGKETLNPLLGVAPSKELVQSIQAIVMEDELILGIHDLIVHDYGPGRKMISLHAEVPSDGDFLHMHNIIDNAEMQLRQTLGYDAVIHMDPIVTHDGLTSETKDMVTALAKEIDPSLKLHDFRMVVGPSHTNLIFDLVVPFGFSLTDEVVETALSLRVQGRNPSYRCVMLVEREYI